MASIRRVRADDKNASTTHEPSGPSTALTAWDLQDDIAERRRAAGDRPEQRHCLTCGDTFLSEGWHNRLCRRCARR